MKKHQLEFESASLLQLFGGLIRTLVPVRVKIDK